MFQVANSIQMKINPLPIETSLLVTGLIFLASFHQPAIAQDNDTLLYENFESGSMPEGWNNEYEKGTIKWQYRDGGFTQNPDIEGSGKPPYAYGGLYNALFHYESISGEKTKLVTQPIDLAYKVKPELTFWHAQDERWAVDAFRNDELRVYYKTSRDGPWVKLAEYTSLVSEWEKRNILLPDSSLSETYYLAFEGKTNNGFGVCIDEVMVKEGGITSKYVEDISYHQASTDFVATRSDNNPILRLDIEIEGNEGNISLDSLAVTSLNTNDSDIKPHGVKIRASNDTVFENSWQVGSGIDFSAGKAVFENLDYEIPRGLSSLWITYDIRADSNHTTQGHILDARIDPDDIKINQQTFPLVYKSPAGSREIYESILYEDFEASSGWSFTGEFERAQAQDPPLGGTIGNPDPDRAYQGSYMIGTDITGQGSTEGDYEDNLSNRAYKATSPMLDAFYYQDMNLYFYRWLNVDGLDSAYIDVSQDNGQTWENMWQNTGTIVMDQWEKMGLELKEYINRTDSVRLRFSIGGTDDSWTFSGWNIDNLVLTGDYISQDVGVTGWIFPINGCGHTDEESVQVQLTNFGGDPTTDTIPLSYSFDGGSTLVKDTLYQSIPVGGTATYTFENPINLSQPGWYRHVYAQTDLEKDEDNSNDRFNHELFVSPTYTPPHYEDFEGNYGYWLKNHENSTLEHGEPSGTIVDTAASGTKVWMTHLDGVYPINDSSYMESPCFNFADMRNPVFELKLRGQAEKSKDGLALYYSVDNGVTWQQVPRQADFNWNWYTSGHVEGLNGPGWDSTFTQWTRAKQLLPSETAGQSNVKFTLVFASDPYNRYEGYAIDDIKVYEAPPDVGVSSMSHPTTQCELSNHVQPQVYIANYGIDTLFAGTQIPLALQFKDHPLIQDTLELSSILIPGDSTLHTFTDSLDMSYAGDYPFKIYTRMEDDPYFYTQVNTDTLTDTISVLGMPRYDIGHVIGTPAPVDTTLDAGEGFANYDWSTGATTQTIQINSPGWFKVTVTNDTGCMATDSVKVVDSDINTGITQIITSVDDACEHPNPYEYTVEISNMGLADLNPDDTIPLGYQINDRQPVADTLFLTQTLSNTGPDSTLQFTFNESLDLSQPNTYQLKFYTAFDDDYDRRNDTAFTTVNTWGYPDTHLRYDTLLTTQADSLILDAGEGFSSYLWQDGSTNPTFNIHHNRTQWYKVTVTDSHGCGEDADSTHIISTDIAIDSLIYPLSSCEFSSSEQAVIRIGNHSSDTLLPGFDIPMEMEVDGNFHSHILSLSDSIMPGGYRDVTLAPVFDISAEGSHSFRVYSAKSPDANLSNDTLQKKIHTWGYPDVEIARDTIYTTQADTIELSAGTGFDTYLWQDGSVNESFQVSKNYSALYKVTVSGEHGCGTDSDSVQVFTYNLGITEMLAPTSDCELSSSESIRVRIKNFSHDTLKTGHRIPMGYKLEGEETYRDTAILVSNLLPGQTFTHTFSEGADLSALHTTYRFNLFTDYPHEVERNNDTLVDAVKTHGYPEFTLNYNRLYTTRADTVKLYPDLAENAYLWQDGSNADTFYVEKNTTETYHLTITDLNGCSYADSAEIITYDLAADSMLNPVDACEQGAEENLIVRIRNHGADTLQSGRPLPLGYSFNGGSIVEESHTLSSPLYPDSTLDVTFSETFDLSALGSYHFTVFSSLSEDARTSNDTLSRSADHYGYPQVDLGPDTLFTNRADTLTLEAPSGYDSYLWQDGSTGETFSITSRASKLYHLTVTNKNGCSVSDSLWIVATDIQMLSLVSPQSGCGLSHQEEVTVELYNNSASSIPGGETLTLTLVTPQGTIHEDVLNLSGAFQAGDTLNFTYSRNVDLSLAQTYEMEVYLDHQKDFNTSNDTIRKTIEALPTPHPDLGPDTSLSTGQYTLDPGAFTQYRWHDGTQKSTFTLTAQKTTSDSLYYVQVTNQAGCKASDTVKVGIAVYDLSISSIDSPDDLCLPQNPTPVKLTIKNTGNQNISSDSLISLAYQLNNQGKVNKTISLSNSMLPGDAMNVEFQEKISLENSTRFNFQLTASTGGDMIPANNDTTFAFDVYPLPELNLGADTLNTELPYTLDPGNFEAYEWGDGSTSSTYQVQNPGTYSLTVFNQYGCADYDQVVVTDATDIVISNQTGYSATIYPNPASEYLIVELEADDAKSFTLRLVSTQGHLMQNKKITLENGRIRLNTRNLARGIYYLTIKTNKHLQTRKIILN